MTNTTRGPDRVKIPRSVEPLLRRIGALAHEAGWRAYAVGGCVRDWRLGRRGAVDIDVTVEGDGVALARAAAKALGGELTAHAQFGTASLRGISAAAGRLDFATCRSETYARPAAYPRVRPGTLKDDLFRRDFTVNAMAAGIGPAGFGALIDPFGGAKDLAAGRLRVLHARSFQDDPTRILRGVRFACRLGLRWEPRTRRWLTEAAEAHALSWVNPGRLQRELDRILREPRPLACFRMLADLLE